MDFVYSVSPGWILVGLTCIASAVWKFSASVPSPPTIAFLAKRTLLVSAHPDDEAMFFVPTLSAMRNVSILCLSNGNYDGLGKMREKELYQCAQVLHIPPESIKVVDEECLQDGPQESWPPQRIADLIAEAVRQHDIEQILTFDSKGVSGHTNHIDTYKGVIHYLRTKKPAGIQVWTLSSKGLIRKYLGVLDVLITLLLRSSSIVVCGGSPKLNWMVRCAKLSNMFAFSSLPRPASTQPLNLESS